LSETENFQIRAQILQIFYVKTLIYHIFCLNSSKICYHGNAIDIR